MCGTGLDSVIGTQHLTYPRRSRNDFTTTVFLATGLAFGQPKADRKNRAQTPEKVEGQVVAVDQTAGRITIRESNGTTHEFQATARPFKT